MSLRAHEFKGKELGNIVWAFAVLDYRDKVTPPERPSYFSFFPCVVSGVKGGIVWAPQSSRLKVRVGRGHLRPSDMLWLADRGQRLESELIFVVEITKENHPERCDIILFFFRAPLGFPPCQPGLLFLARRAIVSSLLLSVFPRTSINATTTLTAVFNPH